MTTPEQIKAALDRIHDQVADFTTGANSRIAQVEQLVAGAAAHASGRYDAGGPSVGVRALHEFADDDAFKAAATAAQRGGKPSAFAARANLDGSIRAALTNEQGTSSGGGSIPSQPEQRGIVGPVARPLRLLDVLPTRPTTSDAVEFVQLTVEGSASEQIEEGDIKAQLDFEGTLARAEIVTIAGWTSASRQVLADHQALQSQIDRTIRSKVLGRLEHQLVNGDGSPGKIKGLVSSSVAFIPTIASTPADVIGEALMRMADAGHSPNVVLLNPADWYRLQITKTDTEGEYLFGSPTLPIPPALWNTSIVLTPSVAESTGLVIDSAYVTVLDRQQLGVTLSNSHQDFFTRNLIAILGELRAGLEVASEWAVYRFDLESSS